MRPTGLRRFDNPVVSISSVVLNLFIGDFFDYLQRNLLEVRFRFFRFWHLHSFLVRRKA